MRVGKNAQLLLVPRMQLLRIVGFEEAADDARSLLSSRLS